VTPEKRSDVGRIAKVLELHAEFGEAGLRMDAPRSAGAPKRSANGNRRRR
jgi:hypothetical protein